MENNVALYRKYRPQSFSEVLGQEHIVRTLVNSLKAGSTAHAYLFSGPRGSGKTTVARLLAKALNCQKPRQGEPCNTCDSCLEITAGKSLDVVEIDAASHTGVDEVRELIGGVKMPPIKSRYKIFIIDECHQLSKSAANALLKTLEEPPAHAVFILATTEAHKMLATITSRCQRFDFRRLQTPEIIQKLAFILAREKLQFEPAALSIIALNARGSFRDSESLLDKCINFSRGKLTAKDIKELLGVVEAGQVSQFLDFIMRQNTKDAILHVNRLADEGVDMQEFAKTLIFYTRQLMLAKIHPPTVAASNSGLSAEELETMKAQAAALPEKRIHAMLESFIGAENAMRHATIAQLPLELAVVDITHKES